MVDARKTTEHLLAGLPQRLAHVKGVADLAVEVADRLGLDPELLTAAAWLHDVGYAPRIASTGFHALDGARFLRREGVSPPVINLVAHHSYALIEADLRGLRHELASDFPYEAALPHDLLCYCDMTTGPSGERVTVAERLSEIRARYGPGDLVTQFISQAETAIVETVDEIETRLAGAAQSK